MAIDCGGAGVSACTDVPLVVDISHDELVDLSAFGLEPSTWEIRRLEGTLNGRTFEMFVPVSEPVPFVNTDIGVVLEHPSRLGHAHRAPVPYKLGINDLIRTASGSITIAMTGVTGGHPFTYSAQEAVLASRYL